jgi:pimeloyl-ACP methyl ester carboxylesterase
MVGLRDASSPVVPDHVLDDIVRRAATSPMARFAATAMTMGPWLLTAEHLRGVQVPMRLVWGVSDQLMPLAYAQRMLDALPDAQLIPVERCGHVPQQEAPDRFLAALRKALEA